MTILHVSEEYSLTHLETFNVDTMGLDWTYLVGKIVLDGGMNSEAGFSSVNLPVDGVPLRSEQRP